MTDLLDKRTKLPKFHSAPSPLKLRKYLPNKPDSSRKPEGEERTKALKRIAGTNLYRSTTAALLKNANKI